MLNERRNFKLQWAKNKSNRYQNLLKGTLNQNREDFKEVHSRMSTMKREISDEINLTFEKLCDKIDENERDIGGLEKWKWTVGGIMTYPYFHNDKIANSWSYE